MTETCMFCGASPTVQHLCERCAARYVTSHCAGCQITMCHLRGSKGGSLCHACHADREIAKLPDRVWPRVDDALRTERRIDAMVSLRSELDASAGLYELLDLVDARLRHLRRTRPMDFPPPPPSRLPDRDSVLAKARELKHRPLAIEAYWDGDTTGWYLVLTALLPDAEGSRPREHHLAVLREGGDIRIFNGQVPPWPEASFASGLGHQIARDLDVPFYFPSPTEPEDSCPRWWQQHEGTPCSRCGIPLLQNGTTPWRGTCYPCHLRNEHALGQKEASS